ncbi:Transmembrane BAX inhibitor motif-containing protein, putative [Ricinus communis]|uniref:Transmembrane BAX inhibitor motif-containing protein, putative n=1 Tax=Ricinus communis TaxID=3988 RepID=B9RSU0_RICCO|nr:Transmembrane BAX inhibitor motif-containing protein, putative [Ricinus communis]
MYGFTSLSSKEKEVDLEAGNGETLYPGLGVGENQLRWGLIRKVYGILSAQLLLTTIVSAATVLYTPFNTLLGDSPGLLLLLCIVPFVLLWPLHVYHQKHPVNLIVLGLFTVSLSLLVGVSCAQTDGKIVLEALILTSAVVCSLTAYTFWAAKKGQDFSFLGPILFTSLIILILTSFIQMFFPLGSTSTAIYGGLSALVFSGHVGMGCCIY